MQTEMDKVQDDKDAQQVAIDSLKMQSDRDQMLASDQAYRAQANKQAQQGVIDSLKIKTALDKIALLSAAEQHLLTTGELLLDTVYFENNQAVLTLNSKPYLKFIATLLMKYPKLHIEVAGHTDNVGTVTYNNTSGVST
jgi:outer membrane protein OmpA-like peptidoglycan-associated protein